MSNTFYEYYRWHRPAKAAVFKWLVDILSSLVVVGSGSDGSFGSKKCEELDHYTVMKPISFGHTCGCLAVHCMQWLQYVFIH